LFYLENGKLGRKGDPGEKENEFGSVVVGSSLGQERAFLRTLDSLLITDRWFVVRFCVVPCPFGAVPGSEK